MNDIHLHTIYSVDSSARPGDLIAKSKDTGLSGICFTDHWDVGYEGFNTERIIPREYAKCELRGLRSESGFKVFCGIEVSPMPAVLDRVREEMADTAFDFVMLSAHFVGDVPQCRFNGFYSGRTKKEAYGRYLSTLIDLIKQYGGDFDALGHYDYISRYSPYPDQLMRYADHEDEFDELLTLLISGNKALEVNTGKRTLRNNELPLDKKVLARYRELGGDLICLGSDAHRASDAGYLFNEYAELIRGCGYKYAVYYCDRKPVYEKL